MENNCLTVEIFGTLVGNETQPQVVKTSKMYSHTEVIEFYESIGFERDLKTRFVESLKITNKAHFPSGSVLENTGFTVKNCPEGHALFFAKVCAGILQSIKENPMEGV